MNKFYLLLLLLAFSLAGRGQVVSIPDANFKSALLSHSPVINTNGDGEIQVSEAQAFASMLNLGYKNIADYTGLEAFTGITELAVNGNPATSLVVTNKPAITRIMSGAGQLTSLTVQGLPLLTHIYGSNNQLNSLTISNLPALEYLDLGNNRFTSLTISGFPRLKDLNCNRNLLTTLSVSNLPLLNQLTCQLNQLTSPAFSNLPSLAHLFFDNNPFSNFSISNLPALQELSCGGSNITSLTLPPLPNLKYLFCGYSRLTSFSLSGYPKLERLSVNNCEISSLSLRNLPLLNVLDITKNKMTDLLLDSLPSMYEVRMGRDSMRNITLRLPSLLSFRCDSSLLTQLDFSQTKVCLLYLQNNLHLQYINVKNNNVYATPGSTYATYLFQRLPSLVQICGDDGDLSLLNNAVNLYLPGQSVAVSSICNFTPGTYNTIQGVVRFDGSSNGCTPADSAISNMRIRISGAAEQGYAFTNSYGRYRVNVTGTPDTVSVVSQSAYYSATPASHIFQFPSLGSVATGDFCITTSGVHPDLDVVLVPLTAARPGFIATYKLIYRNKGNQVMSGNIVFNFDAARVSYNTSNPAGTAAAGTITWNYTSLYPFETRSITIGMNIAAPPVNNSGDQLSYTATINPVTGDETPTDNYFSLKQIVTNSFDPNDKTVLEGEKIDISEAGNYLHYVVRFQNTGTADAINVVIRDSLSSNLDWTTFTPLGASHPVDVYQDKGYKLSFTFNNIHLPAASVDEPGSHGFVAFRVKPKAGMNVGDRITNKADIYFDFNAPIITNTVTTTFTTPDVYNGPGIRVLNSAATEQFSFMIPAGTSLQSARLYNSFAQQVPVRFTNAGANLLQADIRHLPSGIYILDVIAGNKRYTEKILVIK